MDGSSDIVCVDQEMGDNPNLKWFSLLKSFILLASLRGCVLPVITPACQQFVPEHTNGSCDPLNHKTHQEVIVLYKAVAYFIIFGLAVMKIC